ncbi:MAG TPA: LacI family DNA-binding transcriptional regulator [Gemmatimonadaceae bacterium]|nr:LacI family DNA-binding transcriptional regulator [Gemmatimonadaceae bacterium]
MPRPARSLPPVTSKDVAAKAGVSQPTVSLVLSRNPTARVASATRERVLRAAAELGYRPNVVARSLVRRRSYALGVVVPDIANQFFADVVSGAERVATEEGYAVFLSEQRDLPLDRHLESLRARQIDGVILDAAGAGTVPDSSFEGLNVVLIDQPSDRWPGVASDAEGAGRLAAEHLLSLGHRRIAFIGPAADVHGFRMRERGFVRALRDAGLSIPSSWLRRVPATLDGGQSAMRSLLALGDRPTALFCGNDLLALGAHKACTGAGVAIPGAMSIVGCDDIAFARLVTPELTTVAVPARELGARAARLLVRGLDRPDPAPPRATKPLPVRLVVRGSTAAPPPETTR